MVGFKGQFDIGDCINKEIFILFFVVNGLEGLMVLVDFNDDEKLGSGKEKVECFFNLIVIFENLVLNFKNNCVEDDDIFGDVYEYLMCYFV